MVKDNTNYRSPIPASRPARFGGWLADAIVSLVLALPLLYVYGFFDPGTEMSFGFVELFVFAVYGFVAFALVQGYFLAISGQTIGKKLAGTRIVSFETNEILPLPKILLSRYLPFYLMNAIGLPQLINVLFIFGERRQCLHDKFAGTHVINAEGADAQLGLKETKLAG